MVGERGDNQIFLFDSYRLDLKRRTLSDVEQTVALNAKAFDLLSYLVINSGRIVSKDEILNEIWKDQFVEEGNLSVQMSYLRKALCDKAGEPRYLATIPGKGYQFICHVTRQTDPVDIRADEMDVEPPIPERALTGLGRRGLWIMFAGGGAVILILALYFLRTPTAPAELVNSIAVLPFVNNTGEASLDYLTDGLSESVIFSLSRVSGLKVLSRDSSFRFRGEATEPQKIGRELGVRAILTGRVERVANGFVVRTELVSIADGTVQWGEQFIRPFNDVEHLQNDIALSIARTLALRFGDPDATVTAMGQTENHEAYQHYLTGRFHFARLTDDGFKKAQESFKAAIELDPKYAMAHVGLADAYSYLAGWGAIAPNEGFPLAKAASVRAIELDPELAEAYTSLGVVKLFYDLDFPAAELEFSRATMLNPNYPEAYHMLGYVQMVQGRFTESRQSIERSRELDPLSILRVVAIGNTYWLERDFRAAVSEYRKALALDTNSGVARWSLGNALLYEGDHAGAIEEFNKAMLLSGESADEPASLAVAYARTGQPSRSREILEDLRTRPPSLHTSPALLAIVHASLGEKEEAFALLDRALLERDSMIPFLKLDPYFDPLRSDPRFPELLKRSGF